MPVETRRIENIKFLRMLENFSGVENYVIYSLPFNRAKSRFFYKLFKDTCVAIFHFFSICSDCCFVNMKHKDME